MRKRKIEKKVKESNNLKKLQADSLKWFFTQIKKSIRSFPENTFNPVKEPFIGGMFHFIYDAKYKDVLPYWDMFPLVIPVELYDDGFLGLNLHYLPPILRAKLLDALLELEEKSNSNLSYMKVSYKILKEVIKEELFKPCLKRYLTSHIRSNIVSVDSESWEEVAFLPTQKFQKATARKVWNESKKGRSK